MENWLPVVGWEDLYEVSDLGRVRSLTRYGFTLLGKRSYGGKFVNPVTRKDGYQIVNLTSGKSRKQKFIHSMVLEAFVGQRPEAHHACHNNGDMLDNRLENLRWDTVSGNMKDKEKHGTRQHGERSGTAKLTEAQAFQAKYSNKSAAYFAEKYGVYVGTISKIRYGITWKHI